MLSRTTVATIFDPLQGSVSFTRTEALRSQLRSYILFVGTVVTEK